VRLLRFYADALRDFCTRLMVALGVLEVHAALVSKVLATASAPAKGYDEVLWAGEPEWRALEERSRGSIPIPELLWKQLLAVAQPLRVAPPERNL
jgi:LDH2 family malate/lactate/ureidoglycolate dehydrogenase